MRAAKTFQECTAAIDNCQAQHALNSTITDQTFNEKWCLPQRQTYCSAVCGSASPFFQCMEQLKADCSIAAYPTLRDQKFKPIFDLCDSRGMVCAGCCTNGSTAVAVPPPPPTCADWAKHCLDLQVKMTSIGCGGCRAASFLPLCLRAMSECANDTTNIAPLLASADNTCRTLGAGCPVGCCQMSVDVPTICGGVVSAPPTTTTTSAALGGTPAPGAIPGTKATSMQSAPTESGSSAPATTVPSAASNLKLMSATFALFAVALN